MTAVRRLPGVDELLRLASRDRYVVAEVDPARVSSCWVGAGGSVGWVLPSRRVTRRGHLVALGPDAVDLLLGVLDQVGSEVGSVTLPRDADRALRPTYVLEPRNDWDWLSNAGAPPQQPAEADVRWLGETDFDEVRALLERWNPRRDPRHGSAPGRPGVLRWCGVREPGGRLVATAAHTERRPGVPHLASVVTHGDRRGQGLGSAVTAWLTRRLLEEGAGVVTLGMYSDNGVARRVYERLGFVRAHALTSGRLAPQP